MDRDHPDVQWGQGLQIYKTRVGFKEQKGLWCGRKIGEWGPAMAEGLATEVTFCPEPCQPDGSTLSGAKPICGRENKKQKLSQEKLICSFKSTCILKVIDTYCFA